MPSSSLNISPIGIIRSPFKEKFGIPRQPGIVKSAIFEIIFFEPFSCEEAFKGLEGFSHIWIIFIFNDIKRNEWKPTVRPPRAGGNKRMGVFATRSPYRPNPVGMSAVKLEGWKNKGSQRTLLVSGGDFLDGTPVIDIKPYIPYSDSIIEASGGFASSAPETSLKILFTDKADIKCRDVAWNGKGTFKDFLEEILVQDPRPAFHAGKAFKKSYAMNIMGYDVLWEIGEDYIEVIDLVKK